MTVFKKIIFYVLFSFTFYNVSFSKCVEGNCSDGYGKFINEDVGELYGSNYVGEFLNGKYHGLGIYTWSDNAIYKGEFKNGLREGMGVFDVPNGIRFEGEFKDDSVFIGILQYADRQATYTGKFINLRLNGQGKYGSASGEKYVGEFLNGQRHGEGVFTYANGIKYTGGFKDGKFHGNKVIITSLNGESVQYDYIEGKRVKAYK